MTLASQMAADVGAVFLNTDEHAQSVTYTGPSSGAASSSVTVIFEPEEQAESTNEPKPMESRGKEQERRARLFLASSDTVAVEGTFTIGGETWVVESVGSVLAGMRSVSIVRRDQQRTRAGAAFTR